MNEKRISVVSHPGKIYNSLLILCPLVFNGILYVNDVILVFNRILYVNDVILVFNIILYVNDVILVLIRES